MKGNNGQRVPDFEAMNNMNAVSFKDLASNVLKQKVGMRAGWYIFKEDGVEKRLQRRAMQNYLRLHTATVPPRDLRKMWVDEANHHPADSTMSVEDPIYSSYENWLKNLLELEAVGHEIISSIESQIKHLEEMKSRIVEKGQSFGKFTAKRD